MEIIIITAEHMGIITGKWVNLLERLVEVPFGKVIFLTGFFPRWQVSNYRHTPRRKLLVKQSQNPMDFPPCPYPGFCLWKNFSQIRNEETKEKG